MISFKINVKQLVKPIFTMLERYRRGFIPGIIAHILPSSLHGTGVFKLNFKTQLLSLNVNAKHFELLKHVSKHLLRFKFSIFISLEST